jgi:hypothetical protein
MRTQLILGLCLVSAACNKPTDAPAAASGNEPAAPAPAVEHADHPAAEPAMALPLPAVPAGAKVMFTSPHDGDKVEGPLENGKVTVKVQMGAEGIAIKPAGAVETGSGHHHILIDATALPPGTIVPKDETHLHFGKGQTEADVPLAIGPHVLTLQLADGMHRSYGPQLSSSIKIEVVAAGSVAAAPAAPAEPAKPATK